MKTKRSRLLNELKQRLPKGSHLIVAVSGGIDSVCLLHACYLLQRIKSLKIQVVHLDHGFRAESRDDAKFVSELALKYGYRFHIRRAPKPPARANLEAWGRKQRYDFFAQVCGKEKADWILTAHNANDQAETFLMRLFANKELSCIESRDDVRRLLRPLLSITRGDIEIFASENDLNWREDSTNLDCTRTRNKIRHIVLPFLTKEYGESLLPILAQRATSLTADLKELRGSCEKADTLIKSEFGSKAWLREVTQTLANSSKSVAWRLVEELFKTKLGFKLGQRHSEKVLAFLLGKDEAIQLPTGLRVKKSAGGLKFMPTI